MREKLFELIESVLDEEVELNEDAEIIDDLGLSSMEFFNLITLIENSFHIKISDREIQELETVGDVLELVESKA